MYFHIKNRTTGELRYGTWDEEYLYWKSGDEKISHEDYKKYWQATSHDVDHQPRKDTIHYQRLLKRKHYGYDE